MFPRTREIPCAASASAKATKGASPFGSIRPEMAGSPVP
jgi:hypothetical protein